MAWGVKLEALPTLFSVSITHDPRANPSPAKMSDMGAFGEVRPGDTCYARERAGPIIYQGLLNSEKTGKTDMEEGNTPWFRLQPIMNARATLIERRRQKWKSETLACLEDTVPSCEPGSDELEVLNVRAPFRPLPVALTFLTISTLVKASLRYIYSLQERVMTLEVQAANLFSKTRRTCDCGCQWSLVRGDAHGLERERQHALAALQQGTFVPRHSSQTSDDQLLHRPQIPKARLFQGEALVHQFQA